MADYTVSFTQETTEYTVSFTQAARGPAGPDASVTNANVNAAIETDAAATRDSLELGTAALADIAELGPDPWEGKVPAIGADGRLTASTGGLGLGTSIYPDPNNLLKYETSFGGSITLAFPDYTLPEQRVYEFPDQSGTIAMIGNVQDTLVSGENIKTINGESVLGAGDLAVGGSVDNATVNEALAMNKRLWKWREYLDGLVSAPVIALLGDSMLDTASGRIRDALHKEFGFGGYAYLPATESGGAANTSLDFTNWFRGSYIRLSGSGHTATVNVDSVVQVEADTLKLYYVTQPSGGTFKIQTRKNAGSWTDEAGYLTVSSSGTLAGSVITITKTDLRAIWDIRAVWVSGGNVDVIGGALYDSLSAGARLAMLAIGNTNLDQWTTASSDVCQPVIANIAPKLVILSHLDGATLVNSHQATWQDTFASWAATSPTWLIIGPPVGCTDPNDIAAAAQIEAQIALADTRLDAFWDNRAWANMTPAQAIAAGLLTDNTDPHYTTLAQKQWIPLMLRETNIARSNVRNGPADITPIYGATMRRARQAGTSTTGNASELLGDLRLGNRAGATGSGNLVLEDRAGPTNYTQDYAQLFYESDEFVINLRGTNKWKCDTGIGGGSRWWSPEASAGTPAGIFGTVAAPLREINLGKTINTNSTVGNVTIDKVSGRVWFDVAGQTITVTNARCTADSVIMATVLGSDTTATSVRVTTVSAGSFVLTLNAAATAKTAVNFWLIP